MFKVWDKVRCIDDYWVNLGAIEKWKIYTVKEWWRVSIEWSDIEWYDWRFELVKEEQGEPKQGEMYEVKNNTWSDWAWDIREFVCKYNWKYICLHDCRQGVFMYDQIRPIQPKDTLQSVYKEFKDFVARWNSIALNEFVKKMEPFITNQTAQ